MAAGDIWLRQGTFFGHYSAAGAQIHSSILSVGTFAYPTLAHNGSHLFTANGTSHVYKLDVDTDTLVATYTATDLGDTWGQGVALRGNGNVVVTGGSALELLEIDDTGTSLATHVDGSLTGVDLTAPGCAPGGHVVYVSDDVSVMTKYDLTSDTYANVSFSPPSVDPAAGFYGTVAVKPDGGFWLGWQIHSPANGVYIEYDSSGSTVQEVTVPRVSTNFYGASSAYDVDANGNLLLWTQWTDGTVIKSRILHLAKTTGALSIVTDNVSDALVSGGFGGADHSNRSLHVQRGSTTPPPLRQLQRDDGLRQFSRNGPSSVQGSIRQGPRGTYL